jgi:23S rRNA pseudouridine1911/1915/1917 synthase
VNHRAKVVKLTHPQGKLAQLSYVLLEQREDVSLLEIQLHTGRYHQIRAQFSAIGSPIVGDIKYGSKKHFPTQKITLHHARILFPHPITKELISCEKMLSDWKQLLIPLI